MEKKWKLLYLSMFYHEYMLKKDKKMEIVKWKKI